ncbi:MAG: YfhO family protein [Planctomycetes bacterium]|nr:YfhO family protein [Planctomycetota bacterium]
MKRADFGAIVVLLLLPAVLALPFLVGPLALFSFHSAALEPWSTVAPDLAASEPANRNVSDKQFILYPDLVFTAEQLREGWAPLWNPHNFAGLPHQANPMTATGYPFTALATFMDPMRAVAVISFAHLALAGLFAFLYLRSIKLRPGAALAGGLCWTFSGWMSVHFQNYCLITTMVWLPLALFAIERVLRRRPRWALMILALAIGLMMLAGFPQTAVINCWFILAYTLVGLIRLAMTDGVEVVLRRGGFLAAFALLGLCLAAVQLVPTAEFMSRTGHQHRSFADLKADSLRPVTLLHLLVPDFFGNPARGEAAGQELFRLWLLADGQSQAHIPNNYSERSFHVGLLALLLALLAPFLRRDRAALTLTGALVVALLLACGSPLMALAARLPGLDFGSPMRFVQIAGFCLAALFAISLDRLMGLGREQAARWKRPLLFVAGPIVVLGLVVVLMLRFQPDFSARQLTDFLRARGVDRIIGTAALPVEQQYELARRPIRDLAERLGLALAVLAASGGLLYWQARSLRPRLLLFGCLVIVLAELGWHFWQFNEPVHRREMWAPTPGLEFLMKHRGQGRMLRFDPDPTAIQRYLPPNIPLVYDLDDAQGYRALAPRSFLDFMRTLEPNSYDAGYPALADPASLSSPQLDLLRARYIVSRQAIENAPLPLVYPGPEDAGAGDMWIYENADVLPRARLVHQVEVMPPDDAAREFAGFAPGSRAFDDKVWLDELYLGMRSRYPEPKRPESVQVVLDRPGRIELDLDVAGDGLLVLSEQFAPGWEAVVRKAGTGRSELRRILRADLCFMAVPVQADDEAIEFRYRPRSLRWGGLLSGLALIMLLLVPLMRPLETPTVLLRRLEADGSETTSRAPHEEV